MYFSFLWAQIAFGIVLFLFKVTEPRTLIVLGAIINAVAMTAHIALVSWLNARFLPKFYQPRWWRKIILTIVFLFFLGFSGYTLWTTLW